MGLTDRVINIAKGYLDKASDRWSQIDEKAQRELDDYISRGTPGAWERARAKIAAQQAQRGVTMPPPPVPFRTPSLNEAPEVSPLEPRASSAAQTAPAQTLSGTAVDAAYKVLGVAPGSNIETVRAAYHNLADRAAPGNFPDGSAEQAEAMRIERRTMAAYMLLEDTLSPADDRFDRLEF